MEGSTSSKATTSIQKSVTGKKRKQMRSGNVDAQPASQPKESQETKQKGSSVIDSIFEKRPVKPPSMSTNAALVPDAAAPRQDGQTAKPKKQKAAKRGSKDDLFGDGPVGQRRRDEEGLPIFSTEELNIGKGGNTGACPFECDCCF